MCGIFKWFLESGHIETGDGIKLDIEKRKAIREWK
jgi:hypothetical protein